MHKKEERDFELFIVDTLVAIFKVKSYTAEFKSGHDLQHSSLHWDATMRALKSLVSHLTISWGMKNLKTFLLRIFKKLLILETSLLMATLVLMLKRCGT